MQKLIKAGQSLTKAPAFKPLLKLAVMVITLAFLAWTLLSRWSELDEIDLTKINIGWLLVSTGLTLLGHACNGLAWGAALRALGARVSGAWSVRVYLQTNIAKYTPGKVWHFYGRILAGEKVGIGRGTILVSVLIESVQLAIIASVLGFGLFLGGAQTNLGPLQGLALVGVAVLGGLSLNPAVLNRGLGLLSKLRKSDEPSTREPVALRSSLLPAYLGTLAFVVIRGLGMYAGFLAFTPAPLATFPGILGAFSLAWVIGFVVPGPPAGIGVFESAMVLLVGDRFGSAIVLTVVAVYRLTSTAAEAIGALLVSLPVRRLKLR
ncbi:YbhN family protein [Leptolyngbya sp. FACHB-261]|uniref:lysylphosphatidylglycerol synthase transmembrane domain-containing protein n=1 Tax=Leptolyngbya sp. FACHB-261 TaxID=2692806 RepID=UPI00168603E9|nr:YbhN family protein [Leptolyngbya sp. FACHB-261]MBD2102995.1 UPF0104 family protein [Leptolyngbya sp. FACHB-261]